MLIRNYLRGVILKDVRKLCKPRGIDERKFQSRKRINWGCASCLLRWGHLLSLNMRCGAGRTPLEERELLVAASTDVKTGIQYSSKAVSLFSVGHLFSHVASFTSTFSVFQGPCYTISVFLYIIPDSS